MTVSNLKNRIAEYFFQNPTALLRVRQIEREVKVPIPSAIKYTKELVNEKILTINNISGVKFFTGNRDSKEFRHYKKIYNLNRIFESKIIDFFIKEYNNPTIVLFGSFARGEDVDDSDIDIYIETTKEIRSLTKFEKFLGREIQLFKHKNIDGLSNKMLANNILNGIVINGLLEVYPFERKTHGKIA